MSAGKYDFVSVVTASDYNPVNQLEMAEIGQVGFFLFIFAKTKTSFTGTAQNKCNRRGMIIIIIEFI